MTIGEFLELVNEGHEVIYTLFDCNSEDVVALTTEEEGRVTELSRDGLLYSDYADYEIGSMDIWIDKGRIHIEFNIEIDEEEEF